MRIGVRLLIGLLLLATCSAAMAREPDLKVTARNVLATHLDSIVSVKIVSRQHLVMMGRDMPRNEQKVDVVGTVIGADGLTVVSNFMANPMAGLAAMMGNANNPSRMRIESDITSVQITESDGTEIPAHIVLRDTDLDLAFIKPLKKPARPFSFIALTNPSPAPRLLDDLVFIGRTSRAEDRVGTVSLGTVAAVVRKPRLCYIPSTRIQASGLGCPVFNARGEAVGLCVVRVNANHSGSAVNPLLGGLQTVVLPVTDISDLAAEAETPRRPNP